MNIETSFCLANQCAERYWLQTVPERIRQPDRSLPGSGTEQYL